MMFPAIVHALRVHGDDERTVNLDWPRAESPKPNAGKSHQG
ncbi:MAG: hypothetical protein HW394_382 [Acidobacteria bacterium]|nr:hypothetical protein [Acidobacteriota bacterium]